MADRPSLLRTRTIARDLALGMTLTIVLVVVVVGSINYRFSVTTQQQALEREADDLIERLTFNLAEPLWNVHATAVRQVGQAFAAREQVARLYIVNEDSTIVFNQEDSALPAGDLIERTAPIYYKNHEVGRVTLSVSQAAARAANLHYIRVLLFFGLLVTVAVVSVNYLLLRHHLSRPLSTLTTSLNHIAAGDYRQRVPPHSQADLNAIAHTVNAMAGAVEERDQRLHQANEVLESRVALRTTRLQETNKRLEVEVAERTRAEAELAMLTQELAVRNAELKEKNASLELRHAEMERFNYTVSHDLKSPLVTIKSFLGVLEADIAAGQMEALGASIQRLHTAADQMLNLLSDLLELSRVGHQTNALQPVSVRDLIEEALERTAGQITAAGVKVDLPASTPTVWGDRARLVEVYQNLIDNAAKFMGDQPKPRIVLSANRRNGQVLCSVHDNGIGIAPRYHDNIFGLFNRLNPSVEGTGVGLTLVKQIIEVHGGRIWVDSAGEGCGTSFHFSLSAPPADAT